MTRWRSEQVLILPASGMWWQPSHTQLESSGGSRLRQVVTQDVFCAHTHTYTHTHTHTDTFCFFPSLFPVIHLNRDTQEKGREQEQWGRRRWEPAQTATPAATTAVSHRVFGCFCECLRTCVCARARVLGVFHRIANTSPRSESPIGTETSVEWKDASLRGRLWRKKGMGGGEE